MNIGYDLRGSQAIAKGLDERLESQDRQPKFKFGDLLIVKGNRYSNPRHPSAIKFSEGVFIYSFSSSNIGYEESTLELYQEPKVKKSFAYVEQNGRITQFAHEFHATDKYRRDPSFDIEYPEAR